jgi:hypothetical protein
VPEIFRHPVESLADHAGDCPSPGTAGKRPKLKILAFRAGRSRR